LHSFMGHMAKDGFIYLLFCTYFPKAKLHLYIVRIRRHCLCGLRSCRWDACSNDGAERDGVEWRAMMCRDLVVLDQILHSANRNNYDRRAKIYPAWVGPDLRSPLCERGPLQAHVGWLLRVYKASNGIRFLGSFVMLIATTRLGANGVPTMRRCPCRTRFAYFR
jgi:hypothetical protein